VTIIIWSMRALGLWGIALSFAVLYGVYTVAAFFIASHLSGFRWSPAAVRLLTTSAVLVFAGFTTQRWAPEIPGFIIGAGLTLISSVLSIRGVSSRLGPEHRLVHTVCKFRLGRILCGI
jgi:hypothetical protein